jgi:peptidoglycan/xylan/chitin deacetylase (PgdA/CDA1 family)
MAYDNPLPMLKSRTSAWRETPGDGAAMAVSALSRAARRGAITAGLESISLLTRLNIIAAHDPAALGVVFTLHHVRPHARRAFEPNGHLSVTPTFLDDVLGEMTRLGFEPAALDDMPAHLASGGNGRRLFAVTLDDGNRDNALYAAPVFRKHGVPYTIFVTKGFSERTSTMWWETVADMLRAEDSIRFNFGNGAEYLPLRTMSQKKFAFSRFCGFVDAVFEDEAVDRINTAAAACGIDPMAIVDRDIMTPSEITELAAGDPLASFGAHTLTHCDLARATPERLQREVAGSIAAVEQWTGRRPTSFAYPYGFARVFGEREQRAVSKEGIKVAVTTRPGILKTQHAGQLMALPRISLNGFYQKTRYVRALVSGAAFRFTG